MRRPAQPESMATAVQPRGTTALWPFPAGHVPLRRDSASPPPCVCQDSYLWQLQGRPQNLSRQNHR